MLRSNMAYFHLLMFCASLVAQRVKNLPAMRRPKLDLWVGKTPRRGEWQTHSNPGEFHGQRSLADYSPWTCEESDVTERLSASLSSA